MRFDAMYSLSILFLILAAPLLLASIGKVPQNTVPRKSQKKPTSIADLEKRRRELLKITRQKSTHGSAVKMTSSAGRILQRMANVGGCAILMGRVVKTVPTKTTARKGTSIAEIAKSESATKTVTEVLAVCEIFQYFDSEEGTVTNKGQPQNLCDLPAVAVFIELAKALGLGVVGCCIGMPNHLQGYYLCGFLWIQRAILPSFISYFLESY